MLFVIRDRKNIGGKHLAYDGCSSRKPFLWFFDGLHMMFLNHITRPLPND